MQGLFAHIYLLIFGQIAVGGLLSLAVPTFSTMERGFYKSSAVIYVGCALCMTIGDFALAGGQRSYQPQTIEIVLWGVFSFAFIVYLASLYLASSTLRARAFPTALLLGVLALGETGWLLAPPSAGAAGGLVTAAWALAGAVVTGAAASGMLLGHWYLIDTGLDIEPLHRMTSFYRSALRWQLLVVVLGALVAWSWPGGAWDQSFSKLDEGISIWLLAGRVAAWGGALMLAQLIKRTLAIPHTMAATGLFYIAALVVAVGEIMAHYLLFRSGVAL